MLDKGARKVAARAGERCAGRIAANSYLQDSGVDALQGAQDAVKREDLVRGRTVAAVRRVRFHVNRLGVRRLRDARSRGPADLIVDKVYAGGACVGMRGRAAGDAEGGALHRM